MYRIVMVKYLSNITYSQCNNIGVAQKEDAKEINKLAIENGIPKTFTCDSVRYHIKKSIRGCHVVYLYDDKIVGFVCAIPKEKKRVWIEGVVVNAKLRRKHIATQLINEVFYNLMLKGFKKVFVNVHSLNTVAISFYKKNGFVSIGKKNDKICS